MEAVPLIGDYSFRLISWDEIQPIYEGIRTKAFGHGILFDVRGSFSEAERAASLLLAQNTGNPYRLNIGIYHQGECIGTHYGWQENADKFYMCNTAILPDHQNRGVYTSLLPHIISILKNEGFQVISSRHHATNNAVIVPKLKAGFVISGFEISDKFGVLVHLAYNFNSLRRKAMQFRTGEMVPDDEVRRLINL